MGMRILGIDPGRATGWCLLDEELHVLACGCSTPETVVFPAHDVAVIEKPVIYPKSEARASDVVQLAFVAGGLAERAGVNASQTHAVEPRQWKGQLPKHISALRIYAILPELAQALRSIQAGKQEHVIDAAGLAAWWIQNKLHSAAKETP